MTAKNATIIRLEEQVKKHLRRLEDLGIAEFPFRSKTRIPPEERLREIRAEIGDCTRCRLSEGRTHIVFGVGNPRTKLMFVGEGPGRDEDIQGEPFVGRAGQLLTKMIEAMGLEREEVYIGNVIKCRPPENRLPEADEALTCSPFLFKQIEAIRPQVIVALGNLAAQTLLKTKKGITQLRGTFHQVGSLEVMPTFHPAYLLRNPNMKGAAWEDLKKVMKRLGLLPRPTR